MSGAIEQSKTSPLKVEEAKELATFYGLPPSLMNLFFVNFNNKAYALEPFLLYQGEKKGIQRIEVTDPVEAMDGKWKGQFTCKASIYPRVDIETLREVNKLPVELKAKAWEYLTAPTVEWGHASKENVRMSTMQAYLPEMAIKRAVCRALRIFSGYGGTAYEELSDASIPVTDLVRERDYKVVSGDKPPPADQQVGGAAPGAAAGPAAGPPSQTVLATPEAH